MRARTGSPAPVPRTVARIAVDCTAAGKYLRLQRLLAFKEDRPPLPDRYAADLGRIERVDAS